jgi:toxin-antitoxin system PIN domain toxin
VISVDTNILLYNCNPFSQWHNTAESFLNDCARQTTIVISDLALAELYVLIRNPTVYQPPLSAKQAYDVIRSILQNPYVIRVENAPIMDQVWEIAKDDRFARRRIYDVRLALTLQHHGVTHFATANVRDFQGLGFERVWNPLVES